MKVEIIDFYGKGGEVGKSFEDGKHLLKNDDMYTLHKEFLDIYNRWFDLHLISMDSCLAHYLKGKINV